MGQPPARTLACAAVVSSASARYGPGSAPDSPAYRLPSPTPGSSATSRMSAGPPSGAGPLQASAEARAPVRSSPAQPTPVTIQPGGRGPGHHTGITLARPVTASQNSAHIRSAPGNGGT